MAQFRIYEFDDGNVTIADDSGWIEGVYSDARTAGYVAKMYDGDNIIRYFGPIYRASGENRAVTMEDVVKFENE